MNRDEGNERVVFVRSAELPGTEVMVGYNCRYPFYYFHERYALTSCVSVALGVRYRDRDDYVLDRYVMVLEPGKKYFNTYVAKPAQFKVFFIDPQPLADCLRALGFPRSFHFTSAPITSDARLLPLLHQLCASIETGQGRLAQQSLFRACVRAFARHAAHKPPALEAKNGSRAVERAKAYLRERFDKSVSLHQLAIVSGLS